MYKHSWLGEKPSRGWTTDQTPLFFWAEKNQSWPSSGQIYFRAERDFVFIWFLIFLCIKNLVFYVVFVSVCVNSVCVCVCVYIYIIWSVRLFFLFGTLQKPLCLSEFWMLITSIVSLVPPIYFLFLFVFSINKWTSVLKLISSLLLFSLPVTRFAVCTLALQMFLRILLFFLLFFFFSILKP